MTIRSPDLSAEGSETSAIAANRYAHHMVETPEVIFAASLVLKSFILLMQRL
jgi:hypothetical protein